MVSALYPEIPWPDITCVGFDLDGTLYDEFQFIDQAYRRIVAETHQVWKDPGQALDFLLGRWLEKGSSYPHIFGEAWEMFAISSNDRDAFIARALDLFRGTDPVLHLAPRNSHLLAVFARRFDLFLVSDGQPALQRKKFAALGLDAFFKPERAVFTGELGSGGAKPHPAAWKRLDLPHRPDRTIFFGDRDIDRDFAAGIGLHFQKVYNLMAL